MTTSQSQSPVDSLISRLWDRLDDADAFEAASLLSLHCATPTPPHSDAPPVGVPLTAEWIECDACEGSGKIVEEARTHGANQHSACQMDCEECDGTGRVAEMVTLADCPPGLFLWNGSLGFKSEYGAMEPVGDKLKFFMVGNTPDAYCADSGEVFWGGTSNHRDRVKVLVRPVQTTPAVLAAWNRRPVPAPSAAPAEPAGGGELPWRDVATAPKDGSPILLNHRTHGIIQGWFSRGEWSDDTPNGPREYSGDIWILGDDLYQDEVEYGEHGEVVTSGVLGWLPLAALQAAAEVLKDARDQIAAVSSSAKSRTVIRKIDALLAGGKTA